MYCVHWFVLRVFWYHKGMNQIVTVFGIPSFSPNSTYFHFYFDNIFFSYLWNSSDFKMEELQNNTTPARDLWLVQWHILLTEQEAWKWGFICLSTNCHSFGIITWLAISVHIKTLSVFLLLISKYPCTSPKVNTYVFSSTSVQIWTLVSVNSLSSSIARELCPF